MSNRLLTWKQRRAEIRDTLNEMNERTKRGLRDFTPTEQTQWDALSEEAQRLTTQIDNYEALGTLPANQGIRPEPMMRSEPRNPMGYHSRASSFTPIDRPGSLDDIRIDPGEEREARRSFYHYLRTGDNHALAEVRAYNDTAMSIGTDAAGGYGVPVGLVREIKARRDETMLAVKLGCELVEGVGTTIDYAIDDESDILFSSVAEAGNVLQDTPALNKVSLSYVKYGKHQKVSWELERDNDVEIERFLRNWLTRGWAGTHNSLLLTELQASATAALTLDAAAAIGITEIPELVGKLMPEYQERAQWVVSPSTFAYLQGLNSANDFVFSPWQMNDRRAQLWGYPVNISTYAADYAASAKSLIFFDPTFVAYRDGPLEVLVDPYSNAGTGQKTLWSWFSAVYKLTIAESAVMATHPSA